MEIVSSSASEVRSPGRPQGERAPWCEPVMHRRLVAFARRFVGDRGEAEDVAQETLMRAGTGRMRLRTEDRAEAWLFRVCRHAAIDHVRARHVRRAVWGQLPEPAMETVPAASGSDRPRPADLELADVTAPHRLLLGLHYQRGLSQPVLCRMTGLSPSALRVRLYRARRALAGGAGPSVKATSAGGR
jgi:RNA polymerase sigma-70 factor (ECF subfamily)